MEDNLLCYLEACIVLIINWIDNGVCSNYFIPDENMFRVKTDQQLLKDNVISILTLIQTRDYEYIVDLVSQWLYQGYKLTRRTDPSIMKPKDLSLLTVYCNTELQTFLVRNIILRDIFDASVVDILPFLYSLMRLMHIEP